MNRIRFYFGFSLILGTPVGFFEIPTDSHGLISKCASYESQVILPCI